MKLLISMIITGGGAAYGFTLPAPFNWALFGLAAVCGFCVLTYKHRAVIVRIGQLTWTTQEMCRHVLITGDTGSGKTTSGLQPILIQITENIPDWGGLVLGVKGDEHRFISKLAETYGRTSDIIHLQVRPSEASTKWQPPHRYNLLSDRSLPWTTHAKALVDIAASVTGGKQHPFFGPMAHIALANAFELLEELGEAVTIPNAYNLLTNKKLNAQKIKRFKNDKATDRQQELVEFMETNFLKTAAHEQREGIIGTITTYLGFFLDPDIQAVFCSEEPNTFSLSELDTGAILTITMPQRFVTERRYIQTYMKTLFYYHALSRFDLPEKERNQKNTLFLIADEFQDIVTTTDDGISEHKVLDRVRAAGLCVIAGMQSEVSADPAITERKRKVLTLNMRTRFIFRAADQEGATASADFIGKREFWKPTRTTRLLKPVSTSKRKEQEHYVKAPQLMRLRDHTAVVVHPSKQFIKSRIAPLNAEGKIYDWF